MRLTTSRNRNDHTSSRNHRLLGVTGALLVPVILMAAAGCGSKNGASASKSASDTATATATATSTSTSTEAPAKVITSLDDIKTSGGFGEKPTITADWPIKVNETMSKVLVSGTGAQISATSTVEINYAGVDARTGSTFDSSFSRGSTTSFSLSQVITGFSKGLSGKHVGDRVLIAITGADGYDSSGGASSAGIEVGDTLVFVVDIVSAQLSEPSGTTVTPPSGLPTVSGSVNNPSIAFPSDAKEPSSLVVQTLIRGSGKKVSSGDTVTVNYLGVEWGNGRVVGTTYNNGSPNPQTGALTGTIEGWQKGLTGLTVGSRVLLVVPGSQAYPAGNATPSIAAGTTLVYVIDILFTQATSS